MAQIPSIQIDSFPTSVEAFIELRNTIATSPAGGAAMFIVALNIYVDNPELGSACLAVAVDKSILADTPMGGYKGYQLQNSDFSLLEILPE